jgi:hypothetical protein
MAMRPTSRPCAALAPITLLSVTGCCSPSKACSPAAWCPPPAPWSLGSRNSWIPDARSAPELLLCETQTKHLLPTANRGHSASKLSPVNSTSPKKSNTRRSGTGSTSDGGGCAQHLRRPPYASSRRRWPPRSSRVTSATHLVPNASGVLPLWCCFCCRGAATEPGCRTLTLIATGLLMRAPARGSCTLNSTQSPGWT